jgi:hypothetical protein
MEAYHGQPVPDRDLRCEIWASHVPKTSRKQGDAKNQGTTHAISRSKASPKAGCHSYGSVSVSVSGRGTSHPRKVRRFLDFTHYSLNADNHCWKKKAEQCFELTVIVAGCWD